jgi:hypothetical protein
MAGEHGAGNLLCRSTGCNGSQRPHPNQAGRPEAFADSWHNATEKRKRAAPGFCLLYQFQIYLVKKGK